MKPLTKKSILQFSFLATAFAIVTGFAVKSQLDARGYQRTISNQYQHAFTELTIHLNELSTNLQKSAYATSPDMLNTLSTQIFGKAVSAQMALGSLPYSNIELEQTASFLAKTGDYAVSLARSSSLNGGTTPEEQDTLLHLYKIASHLSTQINSLYSEGFNQLTTYQDIISLEHNLGKTDGSSPTLAGSSYQLVEHDFPELPTLIYDGPFSEHIASQSSYILSQLDEITQDEARVIAADFLDLRSDVFQFQSDSDGQIPTYAFTASADGGEIYIEITKQGGYVLNMFHSKPIQTLTLSHHEAILIAQNFLSKQGFEDMTESYLIEYGGQLTINFAHQYEEIICYPDLIKVTVSLDSGVISGFESRGYLMNHKPRQLDSTPSTQTQGELLVPASLTIIDYELALIPTSGKGEVLCHEFKCETTDGQHILIYTNTVTDTQENIFILLEDETGTLVI